MRASASPLVPVHKLEAVKAGGGEEKANFLFLKKKISLHSMFLPWDAADARI